MLFCSVLLHVCSEVCILQSVSLLSDLTLACCLSVFGFVVIIASLGFDGM